MTDGKPSRRVALPAHLIERHRDRAMAALPFLRQGFPAERFAQALERSVQKGSGEAKPRPAAALRDPAKYLEALHIEDVALAAACAEGHEAAWDYFVRTYRPQLYAAARAIVREGGEAAARELADSVYAELYGLKESEGQRRSLFDYFHGRSKLSTWLRAVLAQRYVHARRAASRLESLDAQPREDEDARERLPSISELAAASAPPDPDRARRGGLLELLQRSMEEALAALESRERLRLAYYYVQDLTLAHIGRVMGESEATASRKLERTRRELRGSVERLLRETHRLSDAEMRLCYEYAAEEWPFDLTVALGAAPTDER